MIAVADVIVTWNIDRYPFCDWIMWRGVFTYLCRSFIIFGDLYGEVNVTDW